VCARIKHHLCMARFLISLFCIAFKSKGSHGREPLALSYVYENEKGYGSRVFSIMVLSRK
jgi:hypothetical protein